ncbi:MAG: M60 family metallopeptidase [Candidatus Brocadiia bacterium]
MSEQRGEGAGYRLLGAAAAAALAASMAAAGPGPASAEEHRRALLEGVSTIAAPGLPGSLCVFGPRAFAVVAGRAGSVRAPVVAAAQRREGAGRIVAFGHDGYFGPGALRTADTGRLMANAVRWAAGQASPRVAVRRQGGLLRFLRERGLDAQPLDGGEWREQLLSFHVLCTHPNALATEKDVAAVSRFLAAGGGLVAADTGWGWLQLHRGKSLTADHRGNQVVAPAGLMWSDAHVRGTADGGFATADPPPRLVHAARALDALLACSGGDAKLSDEELEQAAWAIGHAAHALPPDDALLRPRLRRLRRERAPAALPRPDQPLTLEKPLARVLLTLELDELRRLPPDEVAAHPAAQAFPGPVPPDAERVGRTLSIDTAIPGWHSTGLYAAPGEVVAVDVPARAAGAGLRLRIGCHSDKLWHHKAWRRCPDIDRSVLIQAATTRVANPFGGLVYIEVPGRSSRGSIQVQVRGAVQAPYYVLGETELGAWRQTIRSRPAPWAELATDKVVLTVPSSAVHGLDDPQALMRFWDRVADACAELAARRLPRARPERYVTDVQISAGYMHAGYPIMTHLDMAPVLTDLDALRGDRHGGVWGLFHELGHNHQAPEWTFGGTTEVTVNLFTLYVYDTVLGRKPHTLRSFGPEKRAKTLAAYLEGGPDFAQWKRRPFLALLMYIQLQEAFGWEAYREVFAQYRRLPPGQGPRTDAEKRDQWMVRFSRAVGRDLGPFFQAWGVPTSDEARAAIADLPDWMPEGFPPK